MATIICSVKVIHTDGATRPANIRLTRNSRMPVLSMAMTLRLRLMTTAIGDLSTRKESGKLIRNLEISKNSFLMVWLQLKTIKAAIGA